jgi:hypothetical protein
MFETGLSSNSRQTYLLTAANTREASVLVLRQALLKRYTNPLELLLQSGDPHWRTREGLRTHYLLKLGADSRHPYDTHVPRASFEGVRDAIHREDVTGLHGLPQGNKLRRYVSQEQLYQFANDVRLSLSLQITQTIQHGVVDRRT